MSFGTGSMGTRLRKLGPPAFKFDCGRHGQLTARQIAAAAGITVRAVHGRVKAGVAGEALLLPPHESLRVVHGKCRNHVLRKAIRLARAFPDGLPTTEQIMRTEPMCKRQALRWRKAFADMGHAA